MFSQKILNLYNDVIKQKKNDNFFAFFLLILSQIYRFVVEVKSWCYSKKLLKPVKFSNTKIISVGNLTMGGTGKTPFVMELAQTLLAKNYAVAVITRGYKRKSKDMKIILPNEKGFKISDIGDEAYMIKNKFPQLFLGVGSSKKKTLKKLLKSHKIDFCILDDAFQNLTIQKNLNILLIDSVNPFGNEFLFPRGILREAKKNLLRADEIVLTKTNLRIVIEVLKLEEKILDLGFPKRIFHSEYRGKFFFDPINSQEIPLRFIENFDAAVITAIANPSSFLVILEKLRLNLQKIYIFPDHYWFKKDDLLKIKQDLIITTEKDIAKILQYKELLGNKKIFTLEMGVDCEMEKILKPLKI